MSATDLARSGPYFLVSNLPVYRHQERWWAGALWVKDLELHLDYIRELVLACPVLPTAPPSGYVAIEPSRSGAMRFEALPPCTTRLERLVNGLPYLWKLFRRSRSAGIFHFTAAAHPILYGFLVPRIRRRGSTGIVAVVESSFWRSSSMPGFLGKWISRYSERQVRKAVSNAHVTFLTQASYIDELTSPANQNHIAPAVWVDEANFVDRDLLKVLNQTKTEELGRGNLRIAFFGQLRSEKGPDLLVLAATELLDQGIDLVVDIYGDGPMLADLKSLVRPGHRERIRFPGMLKYGTELFETMRTYHAMALPTRSEESPRIIMDAFSQGLPILASDAPGMKPVLEGINGLHFKNNQASDLARLMRTLIHSDIYGKLSQGARTSAQNSSHKQMHSNRHMLLSKSFPNTHLLNSIQET